MAKTTKLNQTIATIVALTGEARALSFAAFADLGKNVRTFLTHGTRNPLADTVDTLESMGKGARVVRVLEMVRGAYAAADAEFSLHKTSHEDVDSLVQIIVTDAQLAYESACADAAAKAKAKADATKAAKEKAAKAVSKAAKAVAPLAAALSIADAADVLQRAAESGDEQALRAIESLAEAFFSVEKIEA